MFYAFMRHNGCMADSLVLHAAGDRTADVEWRLTLFDRELTRNMGLWRNHPPVVIGYRGEEEITDCSATGRKAEAFYRPFVQPANNHTMSVYSIVLAMAISTYIHMFVVSSLCPVCFGSPVTLASLPQHWTSTFTNSYSSAIDLWSCVPTGAVVDQIDRCYEYHQRSHRAQHRTPSHLYGHNIYTIYNMHIILLISLRPYESTPQISRQVCAIIATPHMVTRCKWDYTA